MMDLKTRAKELRGALIGRMESRMLHGEHKYDDGWVNAHPEYHWRRVEEKVYKFRHEVEHEQDGQEAMKQLADLANHAIMYLVLEVFRE